MHAYFNRSLIISFLLALIFFNSFSNTYSNPKRQVINKTNSKVQGKIDLYFKLKLDSLGLSRAAFINGISGLEKLKQNKLIKNGDIITIIDFSRPSTAKRLFIIDLSKNELLFNTFVAHGRESGKLFAEKFSNQPSSLQSSLGFYETASTYDGKNGYSMQLQGLEIGINDRALQRAIVMHGAAYVCESFVKSQGFLGRSWGCPAIPESFTKPIINCIKDGTCLFIYAENNNYLKKSIFIS